MSQTSISLFIGVVTLVLSILIVTFGTGRAYGEVRRDVSQLAKDMAEIKGMFVLRLRDDNDSHRS
jgi:hypothetical protein